MSWEHDLYFLAVHLQETLSDVLRQEATNLNVSLVRRYVGGRGAVVSRSVEIRSQLIKQPKRVDVTVARRDVGGLD